MIANITTVDVSVCELAAGDTIVLDPRGAAVRGVVVGTARIDYSTQTLTLVYRESETGATQCWVTGFATRVGVPA